MQTVWRRRFLFFGIVTSVFAVRFLIPILIVWISAPYLTFREILMSFVGGSPATTAAIESVKPLILIFGGVFLLYLYFHWLFLEEKDPLFVERYLSREHGAWFFAFAAVILVLIMYFARYDPMMMLSAAVGSATFFILYGLRQTAEEQSRTGGSADLSDLSKFIYLEVLDATFSFDGILGAFAFTTNLLLVLIGLGIGALVVRRLTVEGIETVSRYRYLKNGALTSIGFLGFFMLIESYGFELSSYVPIGVTFLLIGVAFIWSLKEMKEPPEWFRGLSGRQDLWFYIKMNMIFLMNHGSF